MVNVSLPLNTHTSESNYLRKWGRTGPCTTCWFPHPAFMVFYCVQMVRVIHQMSQNTQSSWTHFFFGKTITTKTFLLIKQFTNSFVLSFSQLFCCDTWYSYWFEFWRQKLMWLIPKIFLWMFLGIFI